MSRSVLFARDSLSSQIRSFQLDEDARAEAQFDYAVDMLRRVGDGSGASAAFVRTYAPAPTVAMSRRESRLPGYATASAFAQNHGFVPMIRPTGGRAVAYDQSCMVFDLIVSGGQTSEAALFRSASGAIAATLETFGVDARVGPVAGEYCPGEFSVNARGSLKLVGTSQRSVRGARLLSGMLAFGPVDELARILVGVNAALELPWDPRTFGTMAVEAPGTSRDDVESALVENLLEAV